MLETIRLMARYNTHANAQMNKVLATLAPEDWEKDRGGYFPTLSALVGHIYTADVHWMVRFTALRPLASVKGAPFDFPPAFGDKVFSSFIDYLPKRQALDAKLEAFVGEITDADIPKDLDYRNSRGEAHSKNVGGLLLHVFNHQTHHRGAIAEVLDQMGVANDYSNLNALF